MIGQAEQGLRRWQEEVARDPGSPAFVPLADLYRAQGRLDIARRVCLRGLERQPSHVEGHYLLGRIYRDSDEWEKAYDEWDIALSLDPLHTASRRALAFLCLEQNNQAEAERHLRHALVNDPDDPRIRRALRFIERGPAPQNLGADFWDSVTRILNPRIETFARAAAVRLGVVLEPSGRVLAEFGFARDLDLAAFASLAAGVHATSREIARTIGEPEFSQLYQGRGQHQIFLGTIPGPVGELLVLVVFGEETTIGLVRSIYRDFSRELGETVWPRPESRDGREDLEEELAAGLFRVGKQPDDPWSKRR